MMAWNRRKQMAALVVVIALAIVSLYPRLRQSGLQSLPNDPRLAEQLQCRTEKAATTITSGQGKVVFYEWRESGDGSTHECKTDCDVSFLRDRFRVSARDVYSRWTKPHRSVRGRVQRAVTQLTNPRYSNWTCDDRVVSYDGRRTVIYRSSARKAWVSAGDGHSEVVRVVRALCGGKAYIQRQGAERRGVPGSTLRIRYSKPVIIGRQVVGGARCIVVEQNHTVALSRPLTFTFRYWVCPVRGHSVLRGEMRSKGRAELIARWDTRVRHNSGGFWEPARQEVLQYGDLGKGHYGVTRREVVTVAPGFRFNIPARKLRLAQHLPRGTKVHDEVLHKDYVVP